jgi:HEAT repeat protein
VEVAHEALLRSWKRLADWIGETAEDIRWLQRVQTEAAEWHRQGRPDRLLWDYEDLRPVYEAVSQFGLRLDPLVEEFIRPQMDRLLDDFKSAPEYRQRGIIDRFGQIGQDAAYALVTALAYAKGSEVRQEIDDILWQMPAAAERELIVGLGSSLPNIRRAAAEAVARLGVVRAYESLVANLTKADLRDRQAELRALMVLGDARAVTAIVACHTAEKWEERQVVMQALGALGKLNEAALNALREALKDGRAEVRQAAAISLGQVQDATTVPTLIAVIRDEVPVVRAGVVQALGLMRDPRALTTIIDSLGDPSDEVRAMAARSLGHMKAQQTLASLMFALRDKSVLVRQAVAEALGKIAHHHAVRPLEQEVQEDDDWKVRRSVIEAFASLGTANDTFRVRKGLRDRDWQVRQTAARLLGKLGPDNRTIADLLKCLSDNKPEVRVAAVESLGDLKAARATQSLLELLKKSRPWPMRAAAGIALGKIADPSSLEPLRELLDQKDVDAALGAALALSTRAEPEPRVIEILTGALDDQRAEVRVQVMRALGRANARAVVPSLLRQLQDREESVRLAAAEALAALKDDTALRELHTLQEHQFVGVRRAAHMAINEGRASAG